MQKYLRDAAIDKLLQAETARQENTLNLIASENYTWPEVLAANASTATNKYAEGYPGQRYYAGCAVVDEMEQLAVERACKLFEAEHANVQPHAGSQANLAVYHALLKPGDTLLGMSLAEGGHLTHGHKVNITGSLYNCIQYHVDPKTGLLDFDEIAALAEQHKPKLIVCGASAYARTIDFERFGQIARSVGAYLMADIAHIAGLVAAKLHPNPFPHADVVTSTTHKTLRGPRGGLILCKKELAQLIDRAIMPGTQGGPFMHTIAAKAVAFHYALQPAFIDYQRAIIANAQKLATELQARGYTIVTQTTDNHLFIVDLRNKGITGLEAEQRLAAVGITVSRSCIPFDPQKPWVTSGIRLGTPALTARGMHTDAMATVAEIIDQTLSCTLPATIAKLRNDVASFCMLYPIYGQPQSEIVDNMSSLHMPLP
jgi:glycine hydroxymethyltransferase